MLSFPGFFFFVLLPNFEKKISLKLKYKISVALPVWSIVHIIKQDNIICIVMIRFSREIQFILYAFSDKQMSNVLFKQCKDHQAQFL